MRFLRFFFYAGVCTYVSIAAGTGQTISSALPVTEKQVDFYANVFNLVADPTLDRATTARRETSAISRFGLSTIEASAFRAAAVSYSSYIISLNRSVADIVGSKTTLSDSDRAHLAAVDAQRRQIIQELAATFIQQLSAESAARFAFLMRRLPQ